MNTKRRPTIIIVVTVITIKRSMSSRQKDEWGAVSVIRGIRKIVKGLQKFMGRSVQQIT